MKTASVTEAKNQLSAILAQVREGETFIILDRGCPVARLEPVRATDMHETDERSADLERRGLMRRGNGTIRKEILKSAPLALPGKLSAVKLLIDERSEGR